MTFGYIQELDLTDPQELFRLLVTDNESYGATGRLVRTSPKEMILEDPGFYFSPSELEQMMKVTHTEVEKGPKE